MDKINVKRTLKLVDKKEVKLSNQRKQKTKTKHNTKQNKANLEQTKQNPKNETKQ